MTSLSTADSLRPQSTRRSSEHVHRDRQDWWVAIFRGGWLMIAGAFALYGSTTLVALSMLFATAVFISAGVLLTNGAALRSPLPIAQGVSSMVAAAVVAFLPAQMWQGIVVAIAVWALAMGALDLLMVQRHRHVRGQSLLAAAGVLSIIAGVLGLAALPFTDFLPVPLFGALALLTGGLYLGYGLRRRRRGGRVAAVNAAHRDHERRLDVPGSRAPSA